MYTLYYTYEPGGRDDRHPGLHGQHCALATTDIPTILSDIWGRRQQRWVPQEHGWAVDESEPTDKGVYFVMRNPPLTVRIWIDGYRMSGPW